MKNILSSIPVLTQALRFPDPQKASADGLVAVGGDLSVARLLAAYRKGIFPWSATPITWWSPDPRGVFDLNSFHLSQRTQRRVKQKIYRITIDQAFREVVLGCAEESQGRRQTWIEPEIVDAYVSMHKTGHAHSVECWFGEELVGGVYGVAIAGFFAGESMFARKIDASKIALEFLIRYLRERDFTLFDTQMTTPHTLSLGAYDITRAEYLKKLTFALGQDTQFLKKDATL